MKLKRLSIFFLLIFQLFSLGKAQNKFDATKFFHAESDSVTRTVFMPDSTFFAAHNDLGDTKVYHCKTDSALKTFLFPEDILSSDYDVIVLGGEVANFDTSGFEIGWISKYIDGGFRMFINRKQIHLRSVHDNPNPSYLSWVKNINNNVYDKISQALKDTNFFYLYGMYAESNFVHFSMKNYLPDLEWSEESTDSSEVFQSKHHDSVTFANLETLITKFNLHLTSTEKISMPDFKTFNNHHIQVVYGLYDYQRPIIIKSAGQKENEKSFDTIYRIR